MTINLGSNRFFDDLREITGRLNTSIDAINAKLAAYSKPQTIRETRRFYFGDSHDSFGFYGGDSHRLVWGANAKITFKGTVRVELPIFSRYTADTMAWLDQVGFHPDLATLWEATPFSWMVDWFLPIGEQLEFMSGSGWLKPDIFLDGSFSTTYAADIKSYTNFDNFYGEVTDPGQPMNEAIVTGYIREPLTNSPLIVKRPKLKLGLGLDKIGKVALLSDIFGPTKVRNR